MKQKRTQPHHSNNDLELLIIIKKILILIHSGKSQKEIRTLKIVNHMVVNDIFWCLKELNIITTTGYGRSFEYQWVERRKCGNLAVITILPMIKMRNSIRNYRARLKREN